jgi:uncharacterized protein YyaL (SSP411 family)
MIAAMSQAAAVLREPRYSRAARDAADFILSSMRSDDGRLLHSYKDGRARFNAYLDDYACLIDGLTELYQATFEPRYLESALELAERMISQFGDGSGGGFFYTSGDHEALIARTKDSQDNATPSGNGMAATALLRLGLLCGRSDLEEQAVQTLERLSGQLARVPMAGGQSLIAVDFLLGPSEEVVIVDGNDASDSDAVIAQLGRQFRPRTLVLRRPAQMKDDALPAALAPLLTGKTARTGQVRVYICQGGACQEPLVGRAAIKESFATNDR